MQMFISAPVVQNNFYNDGNALNSIYNEDVELYHSVFESKLPNESLTAKNSDLSQRKAKKSAATKVATKGLFGFS